MPEALPERLRTAAELIKNSQIKEARAILARYVRQYPSSVEGWFLLSYVAPQKGLQVDCLMRVLSLNPNHTEAKNRLARLNPPSQAATPPAYIQSTESQDPTDKISPALQTLQEENPSPIQTPTLPGKETKQNEPTALQTPAHFAEPYPERPDLLPEPQTASTAEKGHETPVPPSEDNVSSLFSSVEASDASTTFLPKEPAAPVPQPETVSFHTTEDSPKKARPRFLAYLVQIAGVLAVIAGLLFINYTRPGFLNVPQPTATIDYSQPPTPIHTPYITVTMTPTLTAVLSNTPVPTITDTPTLRPTRTITVTPTLVPVEESVSLSMDELQKQVIGLRGLPYQGPVDRSQIALFDAQEQILGELLTNEYLAKLKIQSQSLSILGLIAPNTNLSNQVINQLADPYGGLYLPWRREIIVTGIHFDPIARFNYTQEFEHYLIDTNFNGPKLGFGPQCPYDLQRCQAINAFFQGDSVLLMKQWAKKYANQADNQEIASFTPPAEMVKEPVAQAYLSQTLKFPYTAGYNFVKTLFDKGGWAAVNQAFKNPPVSTTQILHPDRYLAKSTPVVEELPNAQSNLGGAWNLFDHNVLGEWNTYLLLGYGSDVQSRVDDPTAYVAANGWTGDAYQIYNNPETKKTALVVKWDWASVNDLIEFQEVMSNHLKGLYKEAVQNDQDNGSCWIQPDQIACLYSKGQKTIWIVAPDQVIFETLLKQYPDFP